VIAKMAMSLDGRIAGTASGESQWITGDSAPGERSSTRGTRRRDRRGDGTVVAERSLMTNREGGATHAGPHCFRPVTRGTTGFANRVCTDGSQNPVWVFPHGPEIPEVASARTPPISMVQVLPLLFDQIVSRWSTRRCKHLGSDRKTHRCAVDPFDVWKAAASY